ncbi:MAG: hypothetical protein A2496_12510 [Burkholderiales bacterium RIFOXYC12_FULL_60_6]|nr:MAG: hypothetical protein A2503_15105 [Burkholderiales bacterium RIFOXYD12_FULL_59_19]OGB75471.1 MAG: hypothetical protein A2496_12510 [Burkholderiales bacterium RIFOXYC12_FULL_60_6]
MRIERLKWPSFKCIGGLLFLLPLSVWSAPLDALLSADQLHFAGEFRAELSVDAVNDTLDVLKIRGDDPLFAGTNVGDYLGQHVRLSYALNPKLFVEGGFWRRKITYRTDEESLDSWQLAGQYRVFGDQSSRLHGALRLSAWGNRSPSLKKNTPTQVGGRTVNTISIDEVEDTQTQLDAIASWRFNRKNTVSGFVGVGRGSVSTGNLSATYTSSNGCNYILTFTQTETVGQLAAPCSATGTVIGEFKTSQSVLPEFSYDTSYLQLGGSWLWQSGDWAMRAGYQFQHLNRGNVDNLITSRGGTSYQNNHIVVADLFRRITPHVALFVRGQAMSNQFVGEIPFIYNSVTASKFNRKYGLVSFGVNMAF